MRNPLSALCLAILLLSAPASATPQRDMVSRWQSGDWTLWRIERPSGEGSLGAAALAPGDVIVLAAGGCAGTPDGGEAPVAEAAEISLPGVTRGFEPLSALLDREIEIPLGVAAGALSWRTAPGAGSDRAGCSGATEAFLHVAVRPGRASFTPPAPMDLVGTADKEVNRIPMNPRWGSQITNGTLGDPVACFALPGWFSNPACTGQPTTIDEGSGLNALICEIGSTTPLAGHVNWMPGNYAGPVYWDHHSVGDSDYNMRIPPVDDNGLTLANTTYIKGEFDSRETVDNFSSPWWVAFRDADDGDKGLMVDGREAIMIGLVGTDCEHDCESEVHPVWGLAVHVKSDHDDDVWAIFGRNWGNEGFCSSLQHLVAFAGNRLSFRLPWRPGATGVTTTADTVFYANKPGMSYGVGALQGRHVMMSLQLLSPYDSGRIHGELHLRWIGGSAMSSPLVPAELDEDDEEEEGKAEAWLDEIVAGLDPARRAALDAELATLAGPRGVDTLPVASVPAVAGDPDLRAAAVTAVPDNATAASNLRRLMAIRRAHGKKLPGRRGEVLERAYLESLR